ncbi:hypothetical protein Syun_018015 [Stephania yunnanensis]|uniref:Uncharacterized protein n=1 Tax=Stephania yunnanensis TaxID=152371 RepID=A0AAP0NVD0_9MAGN
MDRIEAANDVAFGIGFSGHKDHRDSSLTRPKESLSVISALQAIATCTAKSRCIIRGSRSHGRLVSLDELWAFYMSQHSKPSTRRWHFAGTLTALLILISSIIFAWWVVFFVPIFGYRLAWYSHFFVEGNVPATFRLPIWSLMCDFKMFGLMLTGRMDREIKRLGKRPVFVSFDSPYISCLCLPNRAFVMLLTCEGIIDHAKYESKPYAVLEAPTEAVDEVEDLSEENRKNVRENTT